MPAMIEDWKKDQMDTGGSTPAKPLDAGKAIMNQYGTYDDLQMGQKVDAKIKSLKAVKDRASAIKDPEEKRTYEMEHKAELDKYDKLYDMRSGNNYESGNYESVNDYLKALAEGKISQTEGFAKIREIRKQILAE